MDAKQVYKILEISSEFDCTYLSWSLECLPDTPALQIRRTKHRLSRNDLKLKQMG